MSKETLSIIIPAYNEETAISDVLVEIDQVLQTLDIVPEIIIVDDGSRDQTALRASQSPCKTPLRVLRLSRNFGKEAAMSAGLAAAQDAHAVIIMDADGQHPPDMIADFIRLWREGHDVVYATRRSRETDSWLRRMLSRQYYKFVSRSTPFIEPNAGDFRLISANAVEALNRLPEKTRFMKGLYNWVGFKRVSIDYIPRQRQAGESKFSSIKGLFRFGIMGFMSFSTLPLRMISFLGMFVALGALVYGVFILVRTMMLGIDVPGWATLASGMAFLGGLQLLSIGMLGEYVGQIFIEVKNRPLYIVAETLTGGGL